MRSDAELVAQVADVLAVRDRRGLLGFEVEVLGTKAPEDVVALLADIVRGVGLPETTSLRLYKASIGIVVGLELSDGRVVVVKVFSALRHDAEFLQAARHIQRVLVDGSHVSGPAALADAATPSGAIAWIDTWVDAPAPVEGADFLALRARTLVAFTETCGSVEPTAALRRSRAAWDPAAVYPKPARPDVDYAANPAGAAWLDALVVRAKQAAGTPTGREVLTHFDWRPANVRFRDGRVTCVYDWDAVQLGPEVLAVANAASGLDPRALVELVDFYEEAGGTFTTAERRAVAAIAAWRHAVAARFEHARGIPDDERVLGPVVADHVEQLLGLW